MKKYCTLLISLCFIQNLHAGGLDEYLTTLSSKCPGVKSLIVKKSLIEITNNKNCNEPFTALLLRECPQLSCTEVIGYWGSFNSTNAGAVIGK